VTAAVGDYRRSLLTMAEEAAESSLPPGAFVELLDGLDPDAGGEWPSYARICELVGLRPDLYTTASSVSARTRR
jgi:hypothetical protein